MEGGQRESQKGRTEESKERSKDARNEGRNRPNGSSRYKQTNTQTNSQWGRHVTSPRVLLPACNACEIPFRKPTCRAKEAAAFAAEKAEFDANIAAVSKATAAVEKGRIPSAGKSLKNKTVLSILIVHLLGSA